MDCCYLIKWGPLQAFNPFHFLDNFRFYCLLDFQSMPLNKLQKSGSNLIEAYANAVGTGAGILKGPQARNTASCVSVYGATVARPPVPNEIR